MRDDDFELGRELCSDDRCIGLVGPDGRCKVCGLVSPSAVADPRHRGLRVNGGDEAVDEAADPDDRQLCPDGTCVGLIGTDGRCKVCGTAALPGGGDGGGAERASAGDDRESQDDDEDRELCPDGTCIGLIGADGRCKICGAVRSPASS